MTMPVMRSRVPSQAAPCTWGGGDADWRSLFPEHKHDTWKQSFRQYMLKYGRTPKKTQEELMDFADNIEEEIYKNAKSKKDYQKTMNQHISKLRNAFVARYRKKRKKQKAIEAAEKAAAAANVDTSGLTNGWSTVTDDIETNTKRDEVATSTTSHLLPVSRKKIAQKTEDELNIDRVFDDISDEGADALAVSDDDEEEKEKEATPTDAPAKRKHDADTAGEPEQQRRKMQ